MVTLETWWSTAAECYRVEDGDMFTYYTVADVVGHFINRERPAAALIAMRNNGSTRLAEALRRAGVSVTYSEV